MKSATVFGTVSAIVFALMLVLPAGAAADGSRAASDVVRALAEEVWSISRRPEAVERRRLLASAIEARTNVDLISRLALGRHWRTLDETLRSDYRDLFSRVVIGAFVGRLDLLLGGLDGPLDRYFRITGEVGAGKRDVVVRSKVAATDGAPLTVDWRFRDVDGRPAIIDVVIEGISLLVTQRAEFSAVIERHRMEGLLASLRARAEAAQP